MSRKSISSKTSKSKETQILKSIDISYATDDKMLEKVEKYVDKNREKVSQKMIEKRSKRYTKNYQEWDLEVLISRVGIESKPKDKTKETSKLILYIIYAVILIVVLIFVVKCFFVWNVSQNT